jgi:hypothetical protein
MTGSLAGDVVVAHQTNFEVRGHLAVNTYQELLELRGAVAAVDPPDVQALNRPRPL